MDDFSFGDDEPGPRRPRLAALARGWRRRCPRCGSGEMFAAYLKPRPHCRACGLALHHHRADDAPPYFTILIVGHVVVPGALLLERAAQPPTWLHMLLWLPLTVALALWLLPQVKGALIGLQWAMRMHGFDSPESDG